MAETSAHPHAGPALHPSAPHPSVARLWALIPCAGSGTRALAAGQAEPPKPSQPKQYQLIAGQPLVLHTLAAFASVTRLAGTLVVVAAGDDFFQRQPLHPGCWAAPCGGATRAASVLGGLQALAAQGAQEDDWVLVHDAARCLVTTRQIDSLIDACLPDRVGGLLAHKLADTLKTASEGPGGARVLSTVDRSDKWLAQTPQMFRLGPLRQALQQVGSAATDEASAMEAMGLHPRLVEGAAHNFKVTYPEDFALAEAVLAQRLHGATVQRFGGAAGAAAAGVDTAVFFQRPGR